jgi:hypothetical protein
MFRSGVPPHIGQWVGPGSEANEMAELPRRAVAIRAPKIKTERNFMLAIPFLDTT